MKRSDYNMRLRKLEKKDAPLMLEWMHDKDVVAKLQTDFAKKTIGDCEKFISESQQSRKNIHLAIADDKDEYMGTVSLKNIESEMAEFAITVRRNAMGKGFSKFAMEKMIEFGINELRLKCIYWCVSPENVRAVRFYDKNGYNRIDINNIKNISSEYSKEQIEFYIWYGVRA